MTSDLFAPDPLENLLPFDGCVHNHGLVLDAVAATEAYAQLMQATDWQPDQLIMFGRPVTTRREVAWHADANIPYTYSGRTKMPQPWTPLLLVLKALVETHSQAQFNACLLNLYHNGQEGMGWHSDDEAALGPTPVIASLSLGAERVFAFKHRHRDSQRRLPLAAGQLIVMRDQTQRHWQHSLPKSSLVTQARINLTFRHIRPLP